MPLTGRREHWKLKKVLRDNDCTSHRKKRALETEEDSRIRRDNDCASHRKKRALETEDSRIRRDNDCACHRKKRALETEEDSRIRRDNDCASHRKKRALETEEDSRIRKQKDSESVSKHHKLESNEKRLQCLQQDRTCKARRRLIETDYDTRVRQHRNKINQAQRRQCSTVDKAVEKFLSKIAIGADFVCTSCHRLLYRNSVVTCNRDKYNKCKEELLESVLSSNYISNDGNLWVCKTCDSTLKRGLMPAQSVGNNLKLDDVPPELANLKLLEVRLISLRIPFLKMVSLPVGNQKSIHGPAVNVPSKLDTLCIELPRLPSQSELIPLKLKRKLSYKGHYLYDYVTPERLLNALRYLKANNHYYKDISINENWITHALEDDEDLMSSLMENPPTTINIDMINNPSSFEASFSLEENQHFNCNANQFPSSPSLPPVNTDPPPFHEEDHHFNSSLEPYSSPPPPPPVVINTSTSTDPVSRLLLH